MTFVMMVGMKLPKNKLFWLQPLEEVFLRRDNQLPWNFFCPLFFHTSVFVLIRLAFILVSHQRIFWDGACYSMQIRYTHFSPWIELGATQGSSSPANSSDIAVLMVEN